MNADAARAADVREGVQLAVVTVVWMVAESAIALTAGVIAGSALLIAFGLDSVIELVSGSILLWVRRSESAFPLPR